MWKISNEQLVNSYEMAVHLRLEDDFLRLLKQEIDRRGIRSKARVSRS